MSLRDGFYYCGMKAEIDHLARQGFTGELYYWRDGDELRRKLTNIYTGQVEKTVTVREDLQQRIDMVLEDCRCGHASDDHYHGSPQGLTSCGKGTCKCAKFSPPVAVQAIPKAAVLREDAIREGDPVARASLFSEKIESWTNDIGQHMKIFFTRGFIKRIEW